MRKRLAVLLTALAAMLTLGLAQTPAHAVNNDGVGESGEFVQWWETSFTQSCYDEFFSRPNYDGKVFKSTWWCPGFGAGQGVANNQRSVANYDPTYRVRFFTGRNYTGLAYDARKYPEYVSSSNAWYYAFLGSWDLNVESHYFFL